VNAWPFTNQYFVFSVIKNEGEKDNIIGYYQDLN
jgi:hypothetical protein